MSQFSGEVEVIQDRAIAAELIKYDKKQKTFSAEGRAHVWDANVLWAGERATYDIEKKFQRLKTEIFGQSMGWAEVLLAESEIVELIKEQNF